MCILCDSGIENNSIHFIMQCPLNTNIRDEMFERINGIDDTGTREITFTPQDMFYISIWKHWLISGWYISKCISLLLQNKENMKLSKVE